VAFLKGFGAYLPARAVSNAELGATLGCDADWIRNVAGIEERRFAEHETVVDLAVGAAEDCLQRTATPANQLGMIIVASGTSPRQFPGPAASVAARLGLEMTPAWDLPMASAGSLFGMALAGLLASGFGNVLLVAAEKMSEVVQRKPCDRGIAVLFGDGAGACLVSAQPGLAELVVGLLCSDGQFAEDLRLEFGQPLQMNGRSVILQASRKIPRAISEVLARNGRTPSDVDVFLMHQANQNLISRVAQALGVPDAKFYSNIRRYGNTSSASMLIAAAEWWQAEGFRAGAPVCFAGFGAGFHWGAALAIGRE
jgi:3-oxoacyl-[acyl-carrier-protein] synthase-3